MKQRTVSSVGEALAWISTNPHHVSGWDEHPSRLCDSGRPVLTHRFFENHHFKLRVPVKIYDELRVLIKVNTRAFDTRMYAVKRGRAQKILSDYRDELSERVGQ